MTTDGLSQWLVRHAARRAPEGLSERLEEEWLADWTARTAGVSRLRFALGCCWATRVIVHEHQVLSVPALSIARARHGLGFFSRRSSTFFLVVSLHAALFYGLISALSHTHSAAIPASLQNQVVRNPRPLELPPSLPAPQLNKDAKIEAHLPELDIPQDADPESGVSADFVSRPPSLTPPLSKAPHAVQQVQGGPGPGFPNPDDFYPGIARRLEEQGSAIIRVCVDVHGWLSAEPTLLQGSGSPRLDEGALKLAKAGSGHYRASTQDGQPVNGCYPFRVRFQIKN